jgi:amidohydrolase
MDALPIQENTGKPYASKTPGIMHACGHDGHTSILIGAARALAKTGERPNNVLLVFQPAEEGGAGGRRMCEDGVLCGKVLGNPTDVIFGLHGFPMLKVGQVATRTGPLLASADQFVIKVTGKGGHAAMPHMGVDPVVVAGHILVALQTIASRSVSALDSVVVTIGMIKAGTAHNIIPDTAELIGTLRTLDNDVRRNAQQRIRDIATNVAAAFGATAEIEMEDGYPVTFNEPGATKRLRKTLGTTFGAGLIADDVPPVMGGEDFSFYGREAPACFYWLGLVDEGQNGYPNLHAPEFDFNDKSLPVGIKAMCSLALDPGL